MIGLYILAMLATAVFILCFFYLVWRIYVCIDWICEKFGWVRDNVSVDRKGEE